MGVLGAGSTTSAFPLSRLHPSKTACSWPAGVIFTNDKRPRADQPGRSLKGADNWESATIFFFFFFCRFVQRLAMRTSGSETFSAAANIFIGRAPEAPAASSSPGSACLAQHLLLDPASGRDQLPCRAGGLRRRQDRFPHPRARRHQLRPLPAGSRDADVGDRPRAGGVAEGVGAPPDSGDPRRGGSMTKNRFFIFAAGLDLSRGVGKLRRPRRQGAGKN